MISHTIENEDPIWTGELVLGLKTGWGTDVVDAELSIRRDTVIVRHAGRGLAVLDRDLFRDWLIETEPDPLAVDDMIWRVELGSMFIAAGTETFRIAPESISTLVTVI